MKRSELLLLAQPLSERLYQVAFSIIPDDLQAEQIVIDAFNAFLLKENKQLLAIHFDAQNNKQVQFQRKHVFKMILKNLCDIGLRRSLQLNSEAPLTLPEEFKSYFSLEPKVRLIMRLRYDLQFNTDEIEDILGLPRYEVIEKIHNGRFLLGNNLNKEATV
jgi:hypothetical protein